MAPIQRKLQPDAPAKAQEASATPAAATTEEAVARAVWGLPMDRPRDAFSSVERILKEPVPFLEQQRADKGSDGMLLGAGGLLHPADTSLAAIPPVLPDNHRPVTGKAVLINGIMTTKRMHDADLQALANTGLAVVGLRNATEGMLSDVAQAVGDKANAGANPAVETAARAIEDAARTGEPLRLIGHSQGALIISRALEQVSAKLSASGQDPRAALAKVQVETFGGAAYSFVDGPRYTHYVNKHDAVPLATGVGLWRKSAGAGAEFREFDLVDTPRQRSARSSSMSFFEQLTTSTSVLADLTDKTVHGPQNVYFPQRTKPPGK